MTKPTVRRVKRLRNAWSESVYLDTDPILALLKTGAAGELRRKYDRLTVFDAVHLGTTYTLEEPIVSTDTLYPDIEEVSHVDPRDLE
ncbi:hypothetical protein G6M89_15750 [Natronolimnobius sp. AArcel1]|nr:hypothetical protein [Natronolimnobius sp. AArcel1]NGM70437.1 hypothetical protein [Natronolimnobius sp. AArcel1]